MTADESKGTYDPKYDSRHSRRNNKNLVFIGSGGRTGTNLLGEVLDSVIEDCFSVHEPDIFTGLNKRSLSNIVAFGVNHMIFQRLLGTSGVRNLVRLRLAGRWSDERLTAAVLAQREHYFRSISESLIIESYYAWSGLVPCVRRAFPRARMVGIIRDPRTFVTSWMAWKGHFDRYDIPLLLGRRLTAKDVPGDAYADRWDSMDQFQRLCWDWRITYATLSSDADNDPLTRIYRFEDLISNADPVVRGDFLDFITTHDDRKYRYGDPSLLDRPRNSNRRPTGCWEDWDAQRVRALHELCGPLMARFGYGGEAIWREKLAQACI